MHSALDVCRRELRAILATWRGWLLAVALPPAAVFLAGQVGSAPLPATMLVAGTAEAPEAERLVNLLRESSLVTFDLRPETVAEPYALLSGEYELLLNFGDGGGHGWSLYTAVTDPARMVFLEQLASGIHRVTGDFRTADAQAELEAEELRSGVPLALDELVEIGAIDPLSLERRELGEEALTRFGRDLLEVEVPPPTDWWSIFPMFGGLRDFGALPVSPLHKYYPAAADRTLRWLPGTIGLILSLLPFVVAAGMGSGSAGTQVPAGAPRGATVPMLIGRIAACLVLTLLAFLAMLVVAESLYSLHIKSGVLSMTAIVLLAATGCAFLGVVVGTAAGRGPVLLAASVYAVSLILLGGVLPAGDGPALLSVLSGLLPLTFLQPLLDAWSFGAPVESHALRAALALALQAIAYGGLAALALRRTQQPSSARAA